MRKIVVLIFCLYPMYSSTYKPVQQLEEPEVRLEKKLETFNKELHQLEQLIVKDEKL